MLLQEFWDDRYVGYCERLREVTRVGYESAWRCHVEPVFGSMELADIGVDDIELWLSGFAGPGAARKAWAVLRQMLRKAAKWGYLEVDVTRLEIDLPVKPLYVPRLLTIGQTRRQLQGFYGHALEAWLIVDSCLALRPEEGYGVDWADIDMRSGITHIQRGVQWVAGHEVVVPPKTELSDRFLPLPRFAVRRLREIRNGRKGRIIGDLTPSQAARRYASWCKKESLPYVSAPLSANAAPGANTRAIAVRTAASMAARRRRGFAWRGLPLLKMVIFPFSPSGGYDMAPAGICRGRGNERALQSCSSAVTIAGVTRLLPARPRWVSSTPSPPLSFAVRCHMYGSASVRSQ